MLGIDLTGRKGQPLKRRLYESLKDRITSGLMQSGEALPSTRELAQALNISRSTVCEAYEMLLAEGYLISRQGAKTVVGVNLTLEKLPDVKPGEP
jgi:GntR family transcriptional regulator/MocR family aminotransferase